MIPAGPSGNWMEKRILQLLVGGFFIVAGLAAIALPLLRATGALAEMCPPDWPTTCGSGPSSAPSVSGSTPARSAPQSGLERFLQDPNYRQYPDHWGGANAQRRRARSTYRTLCVRSCDGYYFPISFATTREHFAEDEANCQSRCQGDVELYVYRNPGGTPQEMVDLQGNSYAETPTAFLYRTKYIGSCSCRPAPWSKEARARHAAYAAEEGKRASADEDKKQAFSLPVPKFQDAGKPDAPMSAVPPHFSSLAATRR